MLESVLSNKNNSRKNEAQIETHMILALFSLEIRQFWKIGKKSLYNVPHQPDNSVHAFNLTIVAESSFPF